MKQLLTYLKMSANISLKTSVDSVQYDLMPNLILTIVEQHINISCIFTHFLFLPHTTFNGQNYCIVLYLSQEQSELSMLRPLTDQPNAYITTGDRCKFSVVQCLYHALQHLLN